MIYNYDIHDKSKKTTTDNKQLVVLVSVKEKTEIHFTFTAVQTH